MAETPPHGRGGRLLRALLGATALALALLGASNAWVLHATTAHVVDGVADAPDRPIAIVLGNRVFRDGSLSRELTARVRVALDLYRAGKVRRLFVSGAVYPEDGYDEPAAMAGWLERRGVPRSAMILDGHGTRTAATMANAAAQGFQDVLVCTQRYHLPRSLYLASHAGLRATGVVADETTTGVYERAHLFIRERLARAETVAEVALRGVRAQ